MVFGIKRNSIQNCNSLFIQTAIKLKLITNNLIIFLLQGSDISAKIMKLLDGSAFTENQINALISTLQFILRNAVAFNVNQNILNKQLVDLGLPKQNVESIVKSFKQNFDKLKQKFLTDFPKSQKINNLVNSSPQIIASTSQLIPSMTNFADVTIKYPKQQTSFIISASTLQQMIFSLQRAKKSMKHFETVK